MKKVWFSIPLVWSKESFDYSILRSKSKLCLSYFKELMNEINSQFFKLLLFFYKWWAVKSKSNSESVIEGTFRYLLKNWYNTMKQKNRSIEMLVRVVSKCVSCWDKTHFKRNGIFKLPQGDIFFSCMIFIEKKTVQIFSWNLNSHKWFKFKIWISEIPWTKNQRWFQHNGLLIGVWPGTLLIKNHVTLLTMVSISFLCGCAFSV